MSTEKGLAEHIVEAGFKSGTLIVFGLVTIGMFGVSSIFFIMAGKEMGLDPGYFVNEFAPTYIKYIIALPVLLMGVGAAGLGLAIAITGLNAVVNGLDDWD